MPSSEQLTKSHKENINYYDSSTIDKGKIDVEDDDDADGVFLETTSELDLSLRKFIYKINDNTELYKDRIPVINQSSVKALYRDKTAEYYHKKIKVFATVGDEVTYRIRLYNEGIQDGNTRDYSGRVTQVTDYLPDGLEFVKIEDAYKDKWNATVEGSDNKIIKINATESNTQILDPNCIRELANSEREGEESKYYQEIGVVCKVVETEREIITNRAEITGYEAYQLRKEGHEKVEGVVDRDSSADVLTAESLVNWYSETVFNESNPSAYYAGRKGNEADGTYEDDNDFDSIYIGRYGIKLTKHYGLPLDESGSQNILTGLNFDIIKSNKRAGKATTTENISYMQDHMQADGSDLYRTYIPSDMSSRDEYIIKETSQLEGFSTPLKGKYIKVTFKPNGDSISIEKNQGLNYAIYEETTQDGNYDNDTYIQYNENDYNSPYKYVVISTEEGEDLEEALYFKIDVYNTAQYRLNVGKVEFTNQIQEEDYNFNFIGGAQFTVEQYLDVDGTWIDGRDFYKYLNEVKPKQCDDNPITTENGKSSPVSFSGITDEEARKKLGEKIYDIDISDPDKVDVYKIVETNPPEGYESNNEEFYLIVERRFYDPDDEDVKGNLSAKSNKLEISDIRVMVSTNDNYGDQIQRTYTLGNANASMTTSDEELANASKLWCGNVRNKFRVEVDKETGTITFAIANRRKTSEGSYRVQLVKKGEKGEKLGGVHFSLKKKINGESELKDVYAGNKCWLKDKNNFKTEDNCLVTDAVVAVDVDEVKIDEASVGIPDEYVLQEIAMESTEANKLYYCGIENEITLKVTKGVVGSNDLNTIYGVKSIELNVDGADTKKISDTESTVTFNNGASVTAKYEDGVITVTMTNPTYETSKYRLEIGKIEESKDNQYFDEDYKFDFIGGAEFKVEQYLDVPVDALHGISASDVAFYLKTSTPKISDEDPIITMNGQASPVSFSGIKGAWERRQKGEEVFDIEAANPYLLDIYKIVETKAPDGFTINKKTFYLTMIKKIDEEDKKIKIHDIKILVGGYGDTTSHTYGVGNTNHLDEVSDTNPDEYEKLWCASTAEKFRAEFDRTTGTVTFAAVDERKEEEGSYNLKLVKKGTNGNQLGGVHFSVQKMTNGAKTFTDVKSGNNCSLGNSNNSAAGDNCLVTDANSPVDIDTETINKTYLGTTDVYKLKEIGIDYSNEVNQPYYIGIKDEIKIKIGKTIDNEKSDDTKTVYGVNRIELEVEGHKTTQVGNTQSSVTLDNGASVTANLVDGVVTVTVTNPETKDEGEYKLQLVKKGITGDGETEVQLNGVHFSAKSKANGEEEFKELYAGNSCSLNNSEAKDNCLVTNSQTPVDIANMTISKEHVGTADEYKLKELGIDYTQDANKIYYIGINEEINIKVNKVKDEEKSTEAKTVYKAGSVELSVGERTATQNGDNEWKVTLDNGASVTADLSGNTITVTVVNPKKTEKGKYDLKLIKKGKDNNGTEGKQLGGVHFSVKKKINGATTYNETVGTKCKLNNTGDSNAEDNCIVTKSDEAVLVDTVEIATDHTQENDEFILKEIGIDYSEDANKPYQIGITGNIKVIVQKESVTSEDGSTITNSAKGVTLEVEGGNAQQVSETESTVTLENGSVVTVELDKDTNVITVTVVNPKKKEEGEYKLQLIKRGQKDEGEQGEGEQLGGVHFSVKKKINGASDYDTSTGSNCTLNNVGGSETGDNCLVTDVDKPVDIASVTINEESVQTEDEYVLQEKGMESTDANDSYYVGITGEIKIKVQKETVEDGNASVTTNRVKKVTLEVDEGTAVETGDTKSTVTLSNGSVVTVELNEEKNLITVTVVNPKKKEEGGYKLQLIKRGQKADGEDEQLGGVTFTAQRRINGAEKFENLPTENSTIVTKKDAPVDVDDVTIETEHAKEGDDDEYILQETEIDDSMENNNQYYIGIKGEIKIKIQKESVESEDHTTITNSVKGITLEVEGKNATPESDTKSTITLDNGAKVTVELGEDKKIITITVSNPKVEEEGEYKLQLIKRGKKTEGEGEQLAGVHFTVKRKINGDTEFKDLKSGENCKLENGEGSETDDNCLVTKNNEPVEIDKVTIATAYAKMGSDDEYILRETGIDESIEGNDKYYIGIEKDIRIKIEKQSVKSEDGSKITNSVKGITLEVEEGEEEDQKIKVNEINQTESTITLENGTVVNVKFDSATNTITITVENPKKKDEMMDLALRKWITAIDGNVLTGEADRAPKKFISQDKDAALQTDCLTQGTLDYDNPKDAIKVQRGNIVTYNLGIFNEGLTNSYAQEVTDYLPVGLALAGNSETNTKYGWEYVTDENGNNVVDEYGNVAIKTDYLSKEEENEEGDNCILTVLRSYADSSTGGDGSHSCYRIIKVDCVVTDDAEGGKYLTNRAEITKYGYYTIDGDFVEANKEGVDRDSIEHTISKEGLGLSTWYEYQMGNVPGPTYPGDEDDDDFETVYIEEEYETQIALNKLNATNKENIGGATFKLNIYNGSITHSLVKTGTDEVISVAEDDTFTMPVEGALLKLGKLQRNESYDIEVTEVSAPEGFEKSVNTFKVQIHVSDEGVITGKIIDVKDTNGNDIKDKNIVSMRGADKDGTVTLDGKNENIQYKLGENGQWQSYTGTFQVQENTLVYAKTTSDGKESDIVEKDINNIDKEVPKLKGYKEPSALASSVSIEVVMEDNASGIIKYGLSESKEKEPGTLYHANQLKSITTQFDGIKKNGTYYVWMWDAAGNQSIEPIDIVTVYESEFVAEIIAAPENNKELIGQKYTTLKAALEAATDSGTTIQMIGMVVNESNTISKNVTIDLNGFTVGTLQDAATLTIENRGALTLKNSKKSGGIKNVYKEGIVINPGAVFTQCGKDEISIVGINGGILNLGGTYILDEKDDEADGSEIRTSSLESKLLYAGNSEGTDNSNVYLIKPQIEADPELPYWTNKHVDVTMTTNTIVIDVNDIAEGEYEIAVEKVDDSGNGLAEAQFKTEGHSERADGTQDAENSLQGYILNGGTVTSGVNEDGTPVATKVVSAKITKDNVDYVDTYTITEIVAPNGYNKLKEPMNVRVTKELNSDGTEYIITKFEVNGEEIEGSKDIEVDIADSDVKATLTAKVDGNVLTLRAENKVLVTVSKNKEWAGFAEDDEELQNYQTEFELYKTVEKSVGENENPDTEEDREPVLVIDSIEDLVRFSNSVNEGNSYSGQLVSLARTLDFENNESYEAYDKDEFGDYNGDGITYDSIKNELTRKTGCGFKPIGTATNHFSGTFDGNGFEIKNMHMKTESYGGLFIFAENAVIKNLTIKGGDISSTGPMGSVMGCGTNVTVSNCSNYGVKFDSKSPTGGIIGFCAGNVEVVDCYNGCEINTPSGYAGGIVAGVQENSTVEINGCHNTGGCTSTGSYQAGGIVGSVLGSSTIKINGCYNTGYCTSTGNSVGGIVGNTPANSTVEINGCYNTGYCTSSAPTGGIVGYAQGDIKITNSYNEENCTSNAPTGGIIGWVDTNNQIRIDYCHNDGNCTSTQGPAYGITAGNSNTVITNSYNTGICTSSNDSVEEVQIPVL